jgi:hypothetical protein
MYRKNNASDAFYQIIKVFSWFLNIGCEQGKAGLQKEMGEKRSGFNVADYVLVKGIRSFFPL